MIQKRNEGDPGSGLQDCKDGINTEACREDKNEEYDAGVKNVNTKSQLTEYNEATTSATGSSSVGQAKDQSSMEKTLAFFLDTPPQRRLKLKRASDASKVNHDKESENSNQIGYDRTKTVAEINVRPHDCQSDTPVTVASQDEDRYRKQKFEPDKSNLALDNNEAKLGECESETTFKQNVPKKPKSEISQLHEPEEGSHKQLSPQKSGFSICTAGEDTKPNVNTTPVVTADNLDMFSQISPNYADALCQAVDAASNESKLTSNKIKQTENETNSSSEPVGNSSTKAVAFDQEIQPTILSEIIGIKTTQLEAHQSELSIQSSENQKLHLDGVRDKNSSCLSALRSKSQHTTQDTSNTQDEAAAIFRMKPRATKKFYYPSPADTAPQQTPANVKNLGRSNTTPKLMAGTLHEVKETDESEAEGDGESGQTTKPSQASSTPASRSSGECFYCKISH